MSARPLLRERLIEGGLRVSAAVSILAIAVLLGTLGLEVGRFFSEVAPARLVLDRVWAPLFAEPHYGLWPLVAGTALTTALALAVALPLGLLTAIYLAELATPVTRRWLKPLLEVLAGVPTLAYGFFALFVVTPSLQRLLPGLPGLNLISPGLVMGIMVTPLFGSLAEDALDAVPRALREAALALGATRARTLWLVVLPAARPGLKAALALAASRVLGETMIVAIAAGPSATMTTYIAQVGLGDVPADTVAFRTLFVVGAALFGLTYAVNRLARGGQVTARAHMVTGERILVVACWIALSAPLLVLAGLVVGVVVLGAPHLDLDFLLSGPSRFAERAGVYPAVLGSLALIGLTAALAAPLGVATAVYLHEYAGAGRFARLVEANIATLAGVPSVLYGLVGLEVFVRSLGLGRTLASGALTLALLALPIVVISARSALRAVPNELREVSFALGATRWQMIRQVVLPAVAPGILTGLILAVSRVLGEAAPLLVLGAVVFASDPPAGVMSPFTALPLQVFQWASRPHEPFAAAAAAGIVVLMTTLLLLNAAAILLRDRARRKRP